MFLGRDSASHIATEIGMSVPAVIDRINKLQESEIITGYKAVVDYAKLGMDISALITLISDSSEHYYKVINLANNKLNTIPISIGDAKPIINAIGIIETRKNLIKSEKIIMLLRLYLSTITPANNPKIKDGR